MGFEGALLEIAGDNKISRRKSRGSSYSIVWDKEGGTFFVQNNILILALMINHNTITPFILCLIKGLVSLDNTILNGDFW